MEIELNKYKTTFFLIFLTISLVIGSLFIFTLNKEKNNIENLALEQAKASFNKDLSYRRWSAQLGGVYVAISDSLKPNPYLNIKNRDIIDTTGKKYTLVNPAYMTRMVHELAREQYNTKGKITSLNPLNPKNKPDNWEKNALLEFEKGIEEFYSIEKQNGEEHFRYIHAMYTEKVCLKCHEVQGYKLGDVRGAISVDIPISPYLEIYKEKKVILFLSFGGIYLISFLILYLSYKFLKSEVIKRGDIQLKELNKARRHKEIIQAATDGFMIFDAKLQIKEVNIALTEMLGYSEIELLKMQISDIEHCQNKTRKELEGKIFKEQGRVFFQSIYKRKDKSTIHVEINLIADSFIKSNLICFIKDITKNIEAERELTESKNYATIIANIAKEVIQPELSIKNMANLIYENALKLTGSQFGYVSSIDPITGDNVGHNLSEMMPNMCNVEDKRIAFPKGENGYNALWGYSLNTLEPFFTNTPKTHKASIGLPEGHAPLLNFLSIPVVVKNKLLGQIALANKTGGFTYIDLEIGKELANIYGMAIYRKEIEEDLKSAKKVAEKSEQNLEKLVQERTEKLEASNEVLKNQGEELRAAIYKLKMAQNQLIQSEKMASLGILVAGVAHEINNPVNFINSSISGLKNNLDYLADFVNFYDQINKENFEQILSMLKQKEVSLNEVFDMFRKSIEIIEIGVQRTTKIVKGLKSFARADETELIKYNVNENIDNTLIILYNQYKNRIQIIKEYNDIPDVFCYAGQINQVLMNIVINAIQSIKKEGEILITTDKIKEEQVLIEIKDSGQGIPSEKLKRIFDPFYTTKKVGEGTGLGLSISYGIIKDHGGDIEVESIPGAGSIFKITLPVQHPEYNKKGQ